MTYCMERYDVARIDHFRGFDEYYSIPYGDATAENGRWEKGPGLELFEVLKKNVQKLQVIAEDLGFFDRQRGEACKGHRISGNESVAVCI